MSERKDLRMSQKHPVLYALTSILANMAVFGFAVLYIMGDQLISLDWRLLAFCLLFLQLVDAIILKHPVSVGHYIAYNLIPAGLLLLAGGRIPCFLQPDNMQYLLFLIPFSILLIYRICRACRPAPQSSSVLTVDGLIAMFILVKIWHHLNPSDKLESLSAVTAAALLAGLLYLAVCRLSLPSQRSVFQLGSQPGPTAVVLGLLLLLALLGSSALLIGERTASVLVTAAMSILHLLLAVWRAICSALSAFWSWLCRLLPDAPPGEYEAYEMPPAIEAIMERGDETIQAWPLLILLAGCAAAAILFFLYTISRHMLGLKTGGASTAKNERRSSHLAAHLRLLLRKLSRGFQNLWTLLAHPGSIPALLLRAHWYGRRRLHARKKGETVREYLARLDSLHQIGPPAELLSFYADQYLYGRTKPNPSKEEIKRMKKAFPIL